jgi:hypothetical protein
VNILRHICNSSLAVAAILGALLTPSHAQEPVSDLTITVSGGLLEYGGVVRVYHLPVPEADWPGISENSATAIDLHDRFAEIQLRSPENGTFTYRFHPADAVPEHRTQVLSVIGTDYSDVGPGMDVGFAGENSAGGRVIRVPALAEIAGTSDTARINAQWGKTEGYDAPPPADERSARALESLVMRSEADLFACTGDERVQVCTLENQAWPRLETRWWRAIAEHRLGRLEFHALNKCRDTGCFFSEPSRCDGDPDSDEPKFIPVN